ncbi:MAG: twin-arginine translocase subunit TatC [Planctomycetales bacterium]|nr:twin-arginine translocase subunit TatC [Planctomycetales bacterium]
MPKTHDEDLFKDSVMTFGEHLEELRGALARALVGLAIGVALGLLFADDVVRLIESPLKEALKEYHKALAVKKYEGDLTPEQLTLIDRHGIAPEVIEIEVSHVLDQLTDVLPDSFDTSTVSAASFGSDELATLDIQSFSAKLVTHQAKEQEVIWNLLSAPQQQKLKQWAQPANGTSTSSSTNARGDMRRLLNELLGRPQLFRSEQFKTLPKQFRDESLQLALARSLKAAEESDSESRTRQMNRWVLHSVFRNDLPRPQPKMTQVATWKPVDGQIITLNAQEAFMVWFKAAFVTGFIIASPWVFYQIWMFVAAGLYPHEKGYVYTFLPFSMALFAAGAILAFVFVFPFVLNFLFLYNQNLEIVPNLRLSEWMSLALFLPIGFGISFQLPLVMLLLERIGVFTINDYLSKWRVAVLVICIISMVLTPADPSSMLLMAIPLVLLYFGGVGLCKWMPKRRSPLGSGFDPV